VTQYSGWWAMEDNEVTPQERLKEIEERLSKPGTYEVSLTEVEYLISRVKRLEEALKVAAEVYDSDVLRKELEGDE